MRRQRVNWAESGQNDGGANVKQGRPKVKGECVASVM